MFINKENDLLRAPVITGPMLSLDMSIDVKIWVSFTFKKNPTHMF
jgi:hypothetical protein